MTGKYDIEIYNKRVHYHLTVKRISLSFREILQQEKQNSFE